MLTQTYILLGLMAAVSLVIVVNWTCPYGWRWNWSTLKEVAGTASSIRSIARLVAGGTAIGVALSVYIVTQFTDLNPHQSYRRAALGIVAAAAGLWLWGIARPKMRTTIIMLTAGLGLVYWISLEQKILRGDPSAFNPEYKAKLAKESERLVSISPHRQSGLFGIGLTTGLVIWMTAAVQLCLAGEKSTYWGEVRDEHRAREAERKAAEDAEKHERLRLETRARLENLAENDWEIRYFLERLSVSEQKNFEDFLIWTLPLVKQPVAFGERGGVSHFVADLAEKWHSGFTAQMDVFVQHCGMKRDGKTVQVSRKQRFKDRMREFRVWLFIHTGF